MTKQNKPGFVLLQAKLNRPRVTRDLIVRPRLLKLLDSGLSEPLTIVVAPAGFGKTTLVSSWIEELAAGRRPGIDPLPTTWLSLDESDSDPNVFLRYFINALQTIFPDAASETLSLLAGRQPQPDVLAGILSNEIEALPSEFIMVLDDIHVLSGRHVFDFLTTWTRHWPRPLHLVLVSRLTPSLPLTALRAKGKLIEVRSRELRFTLDETAEYLDQTMVTPLEQPALAAIYTQLEGWVTGLKLATLSQEARDNLSSLPQEVLSGRVNATNYLIDEVLLRQSPDIQNLLLKVSITGQFCESLCEALLAGGEHGGNIRANLDYLEANELFLIGLDNRQEWYRLHQLFRDLLQQRLRSEVGVEAVAALHDRAARWYAQRGLLEQALFHALECNNLALAGQIMWQGFGDVLNHTDRPTLERWLKMLPPDYIAQQPRLLLIQALHHGLRWELPQLHRVVQQVEALLRQPEVYASVEDDVIVQGILATLRGHEAFIAGQPAVAVDYCRQALALMPPEWTYVRGVAGMYLGINLHATGQKVEAEQFLTTHYEAAANKADVYSLRLLQALTLNALQSGLFETAHRIAQVMLRQSDQSGVALIQGWANYILGYIHYHWNSLDAAERYFTVASGFIYTTQLLVVRQSLIGLADVYQAQGDVDKAMAKIGELSRLDLELYGQETLPTMVAQARLFLRQGDLNSADANSELVNLPPSPQLLMIWTDEMPLTRIRVLIARNGPEDIDAALHALDVLDGMAIATSSPRPRVEILALRALAQLAKGDAVTARTSLIESVELARRSGQIRVYVDLGLPMQNLLGQIAAHRTITGTATRIMGAFEPNGGNTAYRSSRYTAPAAGPAPSEALTARELEILTMMVEPISLIQIAQRLNIADGTVRRHSINLYEKLGVHSRWEAVTKAVEQGILSAR